MTPGPRPLTEFSAQLARLGDLDPAVIRKALADAPGDAHLLVSDIVQAAASRPEDRDELGAGRARSPGETARLVLIVDQFEQVFAAAGDEGKLERAAFIEAV